MEVNDQAPDQTVETPNTPTETPQQPSGDVLTPAHSGEGAPETQTQYAPNFKYNVRSEEREFPEEIRQLIKDKQAEDQWRERLTKLDGFDILKEREAKISETYKAEKEHFSQFQQSVAEAHKMMTKYDLKNAFDYMGIEKPTIDKAIQGLGYSKQELLDYAKHVYNLTPDQEAAQNKLREFESQTLTYEEQLMQERERAANLELRLQSQQVDSELASLRTNPEINFAINKYEATNGPGSFDEFIRLQGDAYYKQGQWVSPLQLAQGLVQQLNLFGLRPEMTPPSPDVPAMPQPAPRQKPHAIPSAEGNAGTPLGKRPESLAELKAKRLSLQNR